MFCYPNPHNSIEAQNYANSLDRLSIVMSVSAAMGDRKMNMRNNRCGALLLLVVASTSSALGAETNSDRPYSPPRTFNGKPDLQGIWANNTATPLERPKILQGRAFLTKEEVAALRKRQEEIFAGDGDAAFGDAIFEAVLSDVAKYKPTTFDASTGNYNAFWLVARDFDNRTSLIVDPPDGRIPSMTDAARQRLVDNPRRRAGDEGPESRSLSERCITFGVPDLLAGYNSYYQIVQTSDAVVFYAEKIHDARIFRIDSSPHNDAATTDWLGDSRARWDGDTLVVETKNLRGSVRGASDKVKLVERFARVGPDMLHYEVTVDDPETWTRPWTLMIPLSRSDDHIYEYACHEGNTGLAGILSGARAEERRAAGN